MESPSQGNANSSHSRLVRNLSLASRFRMSGSGIERERKREWLDREDERVMRMERLEAEMSED